MIISSTKWPLFYFYLVIWKLTISVDLFRPAIESLTYEYARLAILWGEKELYQFRLYDTEKRKQHRLREAMDKGRLRENFSLAELEEIKDLSDQYIKELKNV